ncbi:MAG: glycosyltransferase family 2 protein [Lachnospiraceae bacterium]|nr:glycosyltransferase family 2 protein [Lachnospiraceae bacterium]
MQEDIKLSIIVPIYNIMDCLEKCVHSITNQSYHNLEILLVDDGSTDGTGELCDRLAAEDIRIRVIHQENGGSSSARNHGIREAQGEYLGFVDSDDFIEPDMYEKLLTVLLEHQGRMAQVGRDEVDDAGNKLPDICVPPDQLEKIETVAFLKELLLHRGDCSFCTKLIHRSLFEVHHFPEGVLNEDFHLLVEMLPELDGIYSLPGYSYHVFYRIGSNTRKASKEEFSRVFTDIVDNADLVQTIVDKSYPELHTVAIRFNLFQRLDYMLHIPVSRMNRENSMYIKIKQYLRAHVRDTITSPYLTGKNKIYLLLLTLAPRTVRLLHKKIKHL